MNELISHYDYSRMYFTNKFLNPLIQEGRLIQTIPDKPKSPKQKYKTIKI
ncbi:MAG: hypothetical protein IJO11_00490 [Alphaproteobacteria bacterium]|nr:hypothetical protein [Alphaproteobacteria bacterium]MBQ8557773.1 hypothetical protein [Alphaproteobacteria bacterium]